jgi:hypothetical protein
MVPQLCGIVVSHRSTEFLATSAVPRSDAWVATGKYIVEEGISKETQNLRD